MIPHQVVAYASKHPDKFVESNISHVKMLSLIPDNVDNDFRKLHVDAKDINNINQNIADNRKIYMGKEEKPVTAD